MQMMVAVHIIIIIRCINILKYSMPKGNSIVFINCAIFVEYTRSLSEQGNVCDLVEFLYNLIATRIEKSW